MSAPASGVVAWKSARNFGLWHITGSDLWSTLCGIAVPMKPLGNVSRERGKDRSPPCGRCVHELDKRTKATFKLEAGNAR